MSHAGLTVKYYDPEDLALLSHRAQRERRGHAPHAHGHTHAASPHPQGAVEEPPAPAFEETDVPPPGYVQALLGHEAPPYDPNVDAYARGIDVTVEAEKHLPAIPVHGRAGAACSAKATSEGASRVEPPPVLPRELTESDLFSLDLRELFQWVLMSYVPMRFAAWFDARRKGRGG